MEWAVTILLILPAIALFLARSTWLIDYLVWVTALNRGIRRVVDWSQSAFSPLSPISLTPLMISGLVFLLVVQDYGGFPAYFRKICLIFGAALAVAFTVGLVRNQLAAVYALAEYVAPLAIMGRAAAMNGNERILDRWIRTIGWAAVVVSAYGWYQFYTIPPWDAFWVRAVGFEGYLGQLRPTEMTVFSTMNERGPLAGFLAFAVIPMIVSRRWRNVGGWISVLFILSTILLTFVRSALITVGLAAVLFPLLNRGKNTLRVVMMLSLIALFGTFALQRLPSSEKIGKRVSSIGSITKDGSFQGRMEIMDYGIGAVLSNPIGSGLGSTGLAGRVKTGQVEAGATIGDNGYFAVLFQFGWIGSALFFYGFYLLWKQTRTFERHGIRTESMMMFKALFATGAVALFAGDWLSGAGAIVFFIFAGFSAHPGLAIESWRRRRESLRESLRMVDAGGVSARERV